MYTIPALICAGCWLILVFYGPLILRFIFAIKFILLAYLLFNRIRIRTFHCSFCHVIIVQFVLASY